MNFSQGHSGTKVQFVNRACFPKEKNTRIRRKMGEIHELFVLALSLVWFAGATPEIPRGFEPKHAKNEKPPGGGVMNHHLAECLGQHCWRFLHRGDVVGSSSTRLFDKGFSSGVPQIPSCNTCKVCSFPYRCGGCGAVDFLNLSANKGFLLFRATL